MDFSNQQEMIRPVKVQSNIGEAAINKILNHKLAKSYDVVIPNFGPLKITINNIGIDVQGKDKVVFGYEFQLDYNFVSGLPKELAGKVFLGEKRFSDEITVKTDALKIKTIINFDNTIDAVLDQYDFGPLKTPIKNEFKKIFAPVDICVQEYSTIMKAYLERVSTEKLEKFDMYVKSYYVNVAVGDVVDNISVSFVANIASNNQTFSFDFKNGIISSNKEFSINFINFLKSAPVDQWVCYSHLDDNNVENAYPVGIPLSDVPVRKMIKQYNLREACKYDYFGNKKFEYYGGGVVTISLQTKLGGLFKFLYYIH